MVEMLNTPSEHLEKVHLSGMCHIILEQPSLLLDYPKYRQPKVVNIVSGIHQQNVISSQVKICHHYRVQTAQFKLGDAIHCQY